MIIALVNRKGGTGKTTSAAYLAQALHKAGRDVLGIDLDEEMSWKKWHNSGALPYEVIAHSRKDALSGPLESHRGDVVIDTPPNDGEVIYKVSSIANEVIVPLSATSLDLNRLFSTLKTIEDIEKLRETPLASVLLTRWQGSHTLSQEAVSALEEQQTPLISARIRQLTRYAGFGTPEFLDEYEAVLKELEVIGA